MLTQTRRFAVWGSPIAHSLSPVLHRAAYDALGLRDWVYERREVDEDGFDAALAGLDASWRGLSLTMPLKQAAAQAASSLSETAHETGSVNTLVRTDDGWAGHNTDVVGIVRTLTEAGVGPGAEAVVVGSGATARAAVAALRRLEARSVAFMVRGSVREDTVAQARRAGLELSVVGMGQWPRCDVVVSTVPSTGVGDLSTFPVARPDGRKGRGVLLDVVYASAAAPLQTAASEAGWRVVAGTRMLLHQATRQVLLFTGREAPLPVMEAALERATR